jgi:outer membrane protein assembly factor BamB
MWSYQTGGNVYSSPAVVDGVVYFGSYDGNLYAVGQNTSSSSSTIPSIIYYIIVGVAIIAVLVVVAVVILRKRHK